MATVSGQVTIEDPIGFHARPAGQIVKLVKDSGLEIRMGRQGETLVKASSPLSLMSLKGKQGEVLSVEVDTDDQGKAHELISAIQGFLKG
jgi:phosphotransferase system HPr (HPr) family protein